MRKNSPPEKLSEPTPANHTAENDDTNRNNDDQLVNIVIKTEKDSPEAASEYLEDNSETPT